MVLQDILVFDGVSALAGSCEELERVARMEGWEVTTREGVASLVMRESEDEDEDEGEEEEIEEKKEDSAVVLFKSISEEESEWD